MLNKISKPHIVDFLRMSDQNRWLNPRIRYASVRLQEWEMAGRLLFAPLRARNLPEIEYSLKDRVYIIDGAVMDVPRMSRTRPVFRICYKKVTMTF